jgi:hypothetical protein
MLEDREPTLYHHHHPTHIFLSFTHVKPLINVKPLERGETGGGHLHRS